MGNSKKATIVVVDDDSMMREMLKLMLRSESYSVIGEASNGEEAILLCERFRPGVVLLDINMPKMDGLQALEAIRQVSPATIVIMVSSDATMEKVSEAIKQGASGFVVKPFNSASVLDRVAKCIKDHNKG
jgi:two-component system, chemotaxis family, chemotaxis protein CheY